MVLYHVSKITDKKIEKFVPRIPKERLPKENSTIKRICMSSSLEGCLSAVPWGQDAVDAIDEYGTMLYRVHLFKIDKNDKNLITPQQLKENKYVPDAMTNQEYWYMQEIVPDEVFIINVRDCTYVRNSKIFKFKNLDIDIVSNDEIKFGKSFIFKCNKENLTALEKQIRTKLLSYVYSDGIREDFYIERIDENRIKVVFNNETICWEQKISRLFI